MAVGLMAPKMERKVDRDGPTKVDFIQPNAAVVDDDI